VLDVKVGSGAFMTSDADARLLAGTMVELGAAAGVTTEALLTGMDAPLGRTAGHALEVAEAVEVLHGGGPADVVEVTVVLARRMLALVGLDGGADPADILAAGGAWDVWRRMVTAQGGDPDAALPGAGHVEIVPAPATGFLRTMDARAVGIAAWRLGAGRSRKEDPVSATAGVRWRAAVGDRVSAGAPLLELHTDDPARLPAAVAALTDAVDVGDIPPVPEPLIRGHIRPRDTS
jgi:thymidine phosphorylase